jgi:error-prone DNA polymerase
VPDRDLLRGAADDDATSALTPMTVGEQLVADDRSLALTLGQHPLALLRERLLQQRLMAADVLANYRNGQLARACGIVKVRRVTKV